MPAGVGQLACGADPHRHAAWMMRALAHQALSLKQPHHFVDLIEGALRRSQGHVDGYFRVSGPAAGTVASHTARTLTDLADHLGTEQQHRDALVRWDPDKYKRVHALTHADLGSMRAETRGVGVSPPS